MKIKYWVIIFVGIFIVTIYLLSEHMYNSERVTNYYATYKEAEEKGAVSRGWIPRKLLKSAKNIYEQYDIDTNQIWIRCDLYNSDVNLMLSGFKKLTEDEIIKLKIKSPHRVDWWFECLIEQCPANDNGLNSDVYLVNLDDQHGQGYIARNRTSSLIYYWTN